MVSGGDVRTLSSWFGTPSWPSVACVPAQDDSTKRALVGLSMEGRSRLSIALTSGRYCLLLQWFVPESASGSVTWDKLPATLSQHQLGIIVRYRGSSVMLGKTRLCWNAPKARCCGLIIGP